MAGTGLKKCRPPKLAWRSSEHAAAISVMGSEEVLEAKIAEALEVSSEQMSNVRSLLVEETEEIALDLDVLNDGLDDEVSLRHGLLARCLVLSHTRTHVSVVVSMLARTRLVKPSTSSGDCFLATRATDLEIMLRPFLPSVDSSSSWNNLLESLVGHVAEGDFDVCLGRDLGNTSSHETGAENRETVNVGINGRRGESADSEGDARGAEGGTCESGEHCE